MSGENRTRAEKASSRRYTLVDVLDSDNLALAWQRVRANRGAAGIDGMGVGEFPAFMRQHWELIRGKLEDGSYSPAPVRRVDIPKDGGGTRPLGIPTVLDRLIQQSIAQVLTPLYDPTFSEHSHGFRPMRSAHGAIGEMLESGNKIGTRCHVVDCDLKAFFDTVDHQKLMARLRQRTTDPGLLALILRYLKAGAITPEGNYEESLRGVPQGGPLSPLLANILLDELDDQLEEREHKFVRYADDFVILCRSRRAGQRILRSVRRFLADRLKLIVNEAKSRVVKLAEASFLGFQDRAAQSALDGEEPREVQSESEADHKTDAGTLAEVSDSRTTELPPRLSELLRARDRVRRGTRTRQVDPQAHEVVLLEAVGQTENAQAQAPEAGDRTRRGAQGEPK